LAKPLSDIKAKVCPVNIEVNELIVEANVFFTVWNSQKKMPAGGGILIH